MGNKWLGAAVRLIVLLLFVIWIHAIHDSIMIIIKHTAHCVPFYVHGSFLRNPVFHDPALFCIFLRMCVDVRVIDLKAQRKRVKGEAVGWLMDGTLPRNIIDLI